MGLEHWVWLSQTLPAGSFKFDLALERFPDPEELFLGGESAALELGCLSDFELTRVRGSSLDGAKRTIARTDELGASILTKNMSAFPSRLRPIDSCPPVLYVLGNLGDLERQATIAVVGSRTCSDYGKHAAEHVSSGLAKEGATVISGLAAGIDSAAHSACLDAGGHTIAVQGCGVAKTYPAKNRELKERILSSGGAVISEFPPDAEAQSSYFPIRNRIVSGLSLGIVVIEAATRSGTSITVSHAIEQGRDIFVVPSDIFRASSFGTFRMLREGAIPVSCAQDILEEYTYLFPDKIALTHESPPSSIKNSADGAPAGSDTESLALAQGREALRSALLQPLFVRKTPQTKLSFNASLLYACVDRRPQYTDDLSRSSGLSSSDTAAALTELEIYGLIRAEAGRRFRLA